MRLADRVILLTGAGGGIGAALARECLGRGATMLAVGRGAPALESLRESLPARLRGRLVALAADVTDPADRERIVARAAECGVSVAVHAAGAGDFGAFENCGRATLEGLLATNVVAPAEITRGLLPHLMRMPGAAVVAVGSTFGSLAYPGYAAYSASKFALRGLFEALSREYAGSGVRFQWLAPRATRTGFNPPAVERMNAEFGVAMDDPAWVAQRLADAIESGRQRLQLGWPERLFVRINSVFPGLVDGSLRKQLPALSRHFPKGPSP